MVIVFLGPDGSGKSTIIRHLLSDPSLIFKNITVFHLRPMVFSAKKKGASAPVTNPHGQAPRGYLASTVKLFYLFTDYFVGYALKIWPRPKKNSLVVFDRYYHDMLIDPRRYRFREPMWLARWIGKIIPQPDVWILLDAPAEIMHARKREVTFEETQRQRDAYLKFVSSMANAYVVDSSASPGDTVSAIKKIIQERQRS